MTVKQFVKSNAFRCILVLTCIALVASGLLAILNDVLYVSPEERTARAIKAIYGQEVAYQDLTDNLNPEFSTHETYGHIDNLYLLETGALLFKSTGINGYNGGTVSLWLVAITKEDGSFDRFEKVVYADNTSQTLMSQFKQPFYDVYTIHNATIDAGGTWWITADEAHAANVIANASYSSRAINNAVNMALFYVRNVNLGGDAQ